MIGRIHYTKLELCFIGGGGGGGKWLPAAPGSYFTSQTSEPEALRKLHCELTCYNTTRAAARISAMTTFA
jgi:hypothetical protein